MVFIHALLRYYPFWALPLAYLLFEIGLFFKRRKQGAQYLFYALSGIFVLSVGLWFFFGGYLHSDRWLSSLYK